jgi:hypothetical protein
MTKMTDATRTNALSILEKLGMRWRRVGRGQRVVVHIDASSGAKRALVKTASLGSAMVRTDSGNSDEANLSGFGPDVDHVLFAVGTRGSPEVAAYLVPIEEVEEAYRSCHRAWQARHPATTDNRTWVIWFNDAGDPDCNGFHTKWAKYRLDDSSGRSAQQEMAPILPSIGEIKAQIAAHHRVSADKVRIAIEL